MRSLDRFVGAASLLILAEPAPAWADPAHRDIAVLSVQTLDPQRRATFDRYCKEARRSRGAPGHRPSSRPALRRST
jgi:hypothetical protein